MTGSLPTWSLGQPHETRVEKQNNLLLCFFLSFVSSSLFLPLFSSVFPRHPSVSFSFFLLFLFFFCLVFFTLLHARRTLYEPVNVSMAVFCNNGTSNHITLLEGTCGTTAWDLISARMTYSATITLDNIGATRTYVMQREEHVWNVCVLQREHLSNPACSSVSFPLVLNSETADGFSSTQLLSQYSSRFTAHRY
jgi:hypothetical protein